jgi:hypothetical protein
MPMVAAVMLVSRGPEMVARAVASYNAQTYSRRIMVSWPGNSGKTIGRYRNEAVESVHADIICHFDDDDWSHPNRIAEQVAFLQASGADAVGYREMLFWREPSSKDAPGSVTFDGRAFTEHDPHPVELPGEAWLFSSPAPNYCLGTSLCYWRKTWERVPFQNVNRAEDTLWQYRIKARACSAMLSEKHYTIANDPLMIASISAYTSERVGHSQEWKRVPAWDSICKETMKL